MNLTKYLKQNLLPNNELYKDVQLTVDDLLNLPDGELKDKWLPAIEVKNVISILLNSNQIE